MLKEESQQQVQHPILKLLRFCGEELYPITKATWQLYKDDVNELWLEIYAGPGITLSEDTKSLSGQPSWELTYKADNLDVSSLKAGFRAEIPSGYDESIEDYITNFYYCEHEPTNNNIIEIIAVEGDRLLIRLTGETLDVNYYDGSKPATKLFLETWFEKK